MQPPCTRRRARLPGNTSLTVLALLPALATSSLHAQTPPDAGQLQRQSEQSLQPPPAAIAPPAAPAPAAVDRSGPQLVIQRFVIEGASLIPAEELARQLDPYRGQALSLGELQAAAQTLVGTYRERGWYARVQLPPQDATGGTLRIRVIEGRFGRLLPKGDTAGRSDRATVERMVGQRLHPGEPYSQDDLERGLLLANDLPGVRVDGVLQAGEQVGTSDLALTLQDGPLLTGQAGLNNAGSRFTGRAQASAQLALNNPSGHGDQAILSALASERLTYLGAGYSLPLGSDGWRASLAHSELRYRLGEDFAVLEARGTARTSTIGVAYPLRRSSDSSLWLGLDAAHSRYHDDILGAPLRNRRLDTLTLRLWGNARDGWGGGGASDWQVALGHSRLSLGLPIERVLDAATVQAAGNATRLSYELRREQRLASLLPGYYLRVRVVGQQASGNLESSQKMVLGGPWGVRGFSIDDGQGDSAVLAQLELHRPLSWGRTGGEETGPARGAFDAFVFLDGGLVRRLQDPWPGWDGVVKGRNSYGLAAAGLGLNWIGASGLSASAMLATPLGGNPGSGVAGHNQDGSRTATRLWLTVSQRF